MRVSYLWLKEYIEELDISPGELAERLTMAGLEVESAEDFNPGITGVVIGKIRRIFPHPRNVKVRLVEVDTGENENKVIVCGAYNIKVGDRVPTALPGAVLPGGKVIGEMRFGEVVSQGMLCSADELGLELVQEEEGILILDGALPPGGDLAELLELNDQILVLGLTPNRADCLAMAGVAYEVGALLGKPVKLPPSEPPETAARADSVVKIEVSDPELCPRYTARIIQDLEMGPSPVWMQLRLLKSGIRPISNVVDITNYVMWEFGQPLHAFDYSLLEEQTIVVRRAVAGEALVTLDGTERKLTPEDLVIADARNAVGLAGVMGGENTEIGTATRQVLIEAAQFNPVSIRRTSRRLGLSTEAAQRFEKGVNPEWVLAGQNRAARLMSELAGGKVLRGVIDIYPHPYKPLTIEVTPRHITDILGVEIPAVTMRNILTGLGFSVNTGGGRKGWRVTVPVHRPDVTLEEDVVEEIARHYGYDRIPTALPEGKIVSSRESKKGRFTRAVRETLVGLGFSEAITYSFINPSLLDKLGLPENDYRRQAIPLQNPISEDQGIMRTTLLPGLLNAIKLNQDYQAGLQLLFELGSVYIPVELPLKELPLEKPCLAMAGTGSSPYRSWYEPSREIDLFYLKGALEALFAGTAGEGFSFANAGLPFLHPTRSGQVKYREKTIGYLGALHPDAARAFDFKQEVVVAEIDLSSLTLRDQSNSFRPLPRYPASLRDLAVVAPPKVSSLEIRECILQAGGELVEEVTLFDVYEGKSIRSGYRSLAYAIVYRSSDHTLTDAQVSEAHRRIEKALLSDLGVSVRQ